MKEDLSPELQPELSEACRRHKQKSHDGKRQYTKQAAIQEMYSLAECTGDWISAYPCDFCIWWHVGNYNKIAERLGIKPRERAVGRNPTTAVPGTYGIGSALGDMAAVLKKAFPHTPLTQWNEHLRLCAHCADAFPRGRRLCKAGDNLYFARLAWGARQIVKERNRHSGGKAQPAGGSP